MSRPLQLAAALIGLALLAVLGRMAMEREARGPDRSRPGGGNTAPGPIPAASRGAVLSAAGPRGPLAPLPVEFRDMPPAETGVDFVHTWGGGAMDNLVKATGGGVTLFDSDGDGDLDLYFSQGAVHPVAAPGEPPAVPPRNRLYRNEGGWRFTDATEGSGLGDPGYGMGAAAADFDGDGDQDLFVSNFGRCRLYRNDGGRFADATAEAGLDLDGFFVGGAWGDADGDGCLDLLACGYVVFDPAAKAGGPGEPFPGPLAYRGEPVRLLRGRPDGTFEDVTMPAGLWTTEGRGMCVAFADLLGTGTPQILVSNDAVPNQVLERGKDGKYVDVGFLLGMAFSGLGQARSSMGLGVADFDRDGRPDVAIPDGSGGTLYRNLGTRVEDRAGPAGIDGAMRGRTGWSGTPVDYDLDGWTDLALTCGALHALDPEEPVLFRNAGGGIFEDATRATGFGRKACGRGCAAGDLDGDGDPDVVIAVLGGAPILLRNDGGEARKSIVVRCVAKGRNRDALGAAVEVEAGGLVQREEVRTTQGYLAGSGPDLLFGLGSAARADGVRVRFPSGVVRELRDVPAGRVTVTE